MHGKGNFFDPRLNDANQFPVAARAGLGNIRNDPDLVTGKLGALHFYQLSIPAPTPPAGSFDAAAAARGDAVFTGAAKCATCHIKPLFTESGGICIPARKSASTILRRTARRIDVTEPVH
jgi:hypothetical protein